MKKKTLTFLMCMVMLIPLAGCDLFKIVGAVQEMTENYTKGVEKLGDNYSIVYDIKEGDEAEFQVMYKRAGTSYLYGNNESAEMYDSSVNKNYIININDKQYSEFDSEGTGVAVLEGALFGPYLSAVIGSLGDMKKDTSAKALDRNCIKYTFTTDGETTEYFIDKEYFIIVQLSMKNGDETSTWKLKEIKVGGVKVSDFLAGFPGQYTKNT